jgi:hypothetical protein
MAQAVNVAMKSSNAENFPSAANPPATISVGTAGIGTPSCATSTFANTSGNPYCVIKPIIARQSGTNFPMVDVPSACAVPRLMLSTRFTARVVARFGDLRVAAVREIPNAMKHSLMNAGQQTAWSKYAATRYANRFDLPGLCFA